MTATTDNTQLGKGPTLSLSSFEGPLDVLIRLIQKDEVDIYDIFIREIIQQYRSKTERTDTEGDIDAQQAVGSGGEFLGMAATLLLLKTRKLLPNEELEDLEDDLFASSLEIVPQLLEYCQFKEIAKALAQREDQQLGHHTRILPPSGAPVEKGLGLEHLSVADIAAHFQEALNKAAGRVGEAISEEEWKVADQISWLRKLLQQEKQVPLTHIFSSNKSRGQLIVNFLAVLELMKTNELCVVRDPTFGVVVTSQSASKDNIHH